MCIYIYIERERGEKHEVANNTRWQVCMYVYVCMCVCMYMYVCMCTHGVNNVCMSMCLCFYFYSELSIPLCLVSHRNVLCNCVLPNSLQSCLVRLTASNACLHKPTHNLHEVLVDIARVPPRMQHS